MIINITDNNFDTSIFDGASVAFGVFDGLHLGHRFLIEQTINSATADGASSIVLTFDRDPDEVFRPETTQKIMRNDARLKALAQSGVDQVVVLPFTHEFYTLTPEDFLARTFGEHVPNHLHVGSNFHFGANAQGDANTLRLWGSSRGTHVHAHDLLSIHDQAITATRIRTLLHKGDVQEATALLGHPYTVCGVVEKGRGQGKSFGFATANLHLPDDRLVLADGVYAGYAWIEMDPDSTILKVPIIPNDIESSLANDVPLYKAAISVGVSPTFKDVGANANVEVNLLDFDGDIVGKPLCVEFVLRLRPLQKFDSTETLIKQVSADIKWIRDNL